MASSHARRHGAALFRRDDRPSLSRRSRPHFLKSIFVFCTLALMLAHKSLAPALADEIVEPGHIAATLRSPVANPYCTIPTFAVLALPGQARALLEKDDKPLILIDSEIAENGAYARFLLAHECCHHGRGHLARLSEQKKKQELAWQSGASNEDAENSEPRNALNNLSSMMSHRRMELDADCCAATLLAERGDEAGLAAAVAAMEAFGAWPTGPSYPPGMQRAVMIKNCAATRR